MSKPVYFLFVSFLLFVSCESGEPDKENELFQEVQFEDIKKEEPAVQGQTVNEDMDTPPPSKEALAPLPEVPFSASAEESIQQAVNINMEETLHECEEYAQKPEIVFSLEWTIDSNGYPKNVTVAEHKVGDIVFINCAIKKIETIQFYNVPKGYPVTFHFIFEYPNKTLVYA